jgi:polyisoprenoid-binding protein YceI
MALFSSWWVRGALALVVVAVLAVGAWWIFVRSDAQLATAPLDFREVTATPSANESATPTPSPAAAAGNPSAVPEGLPGDVERFVIVPEHPSVEGATEAAYFADEQLAGLGLPSTAKGSTVDVSGQFFLGPDGISPEGASVIVVDLRRLRSDDSRRDNRVNGALQVVRFPEARFTAHRIDGYSGEIPEGQDVEMTLTGLTELAGVERELTWDLIARRSGDVITALATVNFLYADFDIPLLNIAGFVSVEEDVTLQVQLIAEKS